MKNVVELIKDVAKGSNLTSRACAAKRAIVAVDGLQSQIAGLKQLVDSRMAAAASAERGYEASRLDAQALAAAIGVLEGKLRFPDPVPIRLNCPDCGELHVDEGEWATRRHHTHSCQACGMTWRPAAFPTIGVRFLPGFKNEDQKL